MKLAASIFTGLVAVLHLLFMCLEMFLWQSDFGLKTFGMSPEQAAHSAVLAMNQGFYNGLLAAGLIWSFFLSNAETRKMVRTFFLGAVVAAGVFGAATAKVSILFTQALPALLGLIFVRMSND